MVSLGWSLCGAVRHTITHDFPRRTCIAVQRADFGGIFDIDDSRNRFSFLATKVMTNVIPDNMWWDIASSATAFLAEDPLWWIIPMAVLFVGGIVYRLVDIT